MEAPTRGPLCLVPLPPVEKHRKGGTPFAPGTPLHVPWLLLFTFRCQVCTEAWESSGQLACSVGGGVTARVVSRVPAYGLERRGETDRLFSLARALPCMMYITRVYVVLCTRVGHDGCLGRAGISGHRPGDDDGVRPLRPE